eukprot:80380-Rhodomonas_salina.1
MMRRMCDTCREQRRGSNSLALTHCYLLSTLKAAGRAREGGETTKEVAVSYTHLRAHETEADL